MDRLIYFIVFFIFSISITQVDAQELRCKVTVDSRQIEGSERKIFEEMEGTIYQFVNGRKWTRDGFESFERIDCNILITLSDRMGTNNFKGSIQIQASRPIYKTSYLSPILNVKDNDFTIYFNQFEPLIYSENSYNSELTSILSFYVYMILAYDYDSYSPEGGTAFFQQAQKIVNNAQNSSETGWKANESQRNRYWLVENALSARFKPLRGSFYKYHRQGFDLMESNAESAKKNINESLKALEAVHNASPTSYNMQSFFDAKSNEVINLYKEFPSAERNDIAKLLIKIDPGNAGKYEKLQGR